MYPDSDSRLYCAMSNTPRDYCKRLNKRYLRNETPKLRKVAQVSLFRPDFRSQLFCSGVWFAVGSFPQISDVWVSSDCLGSWDSRCVFIVCPDTLECWKQQTRIILRAFYTFLLPSLKREGVAMRFSFFLRSFRFSLLS